MAGNVGLASVDAPGMVGIVGLAGMPGIAGAAAGVGIGAGLGFDFSSSRIFSDANCGVLLIFLAASMRWRIVGLLTQYRIADSSEI